MGKVTFIRQLTAETKFIAVKCGCEHRVRARLQLRDARIWIAKTETITNKHVRCALLSYLYQRSPIWQSASHKGGLTLQGDKLEKLLSSHFPVIASSRCCGSVAFCKLSALDRAIEVVIAIGVVEHRLAQPGVPSIVNV